MGKLYEDHIAQLNARAADPLTPRIRVLPSMRKPPAAVAMTPVQPAPCGVCVMPKAQCVCPGSPVRVHAPAVPPARVIQQPPVRVGVAAPAPVRPRPTPTPAPAPAPAAPPSVCPRCRSAIRSPASLLTLCGCGIRSTIPVTPPTPWKNPVSHHVRTMRIPSPIELEMRIERLEQSDAKRSE